MIKPIVVLGSVNLDLVAAVERIPVPGETLTGTVFQTFHGGKGGNQAVAIARLGHPVKMVAKVGDDDIGSRLLNGLRRAGVNARSVGRAAKTSSGVAVIVTDRTAQNSIVVIPGANGKLLPADAARAEPLIRSAAMLLLQLEVPLATVERAAQLAAANHVPVMLDPAPARSLPRALLRNVAWLTPNESEAAALCGDPTSSPPTMGRVRAYADELQSRTGAHVVIKLGARGAFIAGPENRRDYVPAFKVRAVDATAAGDAFNGGLAVALTQGRDGLDALRFASAVAALSVTRRGAQPSMPSAVEVEKFLRRARVAPAQLDH